MKQIKRFLSAWLLVTVLAVSGSAPSYAVQQQGKAQPAQETVQSVVAKQAALVSEFEVNGLKVLLKRREGSLTVAAGLFIRGGSTNINAQNAGVETLMLSVATEATTNFPRAKMRTELARMGTVIGSSSNNDYSVLSLATTRGAAEKARAQATPDAPVPHPRSTSVGTLRTAPSRCATMCSTSR